MTKPSASAATSAQAGALAHTLARAFQAEPAFSFIIPEPDARRKALARAFPMFVREDMAKGIAFATPGCEAVTLWRAPGHAHDGLWDMIRLFPAYAGSLRSGLMRGERVSRFIGKHLPAEPVWYLHFAGCDPAYQGRGMGGAAIRAGLARADADGLPAYLETADPGNLSIYAALGFEHVHELDVPGGPHFWGMQRPPR
jgi:ribosomal protein S18 acetylase RimI-like enzyme